LGWRFGYDVVVGKYPTQNPEEGIMKEVVRVKVPKALRDACDKTAESMQGDLKYCKPSAWKDGQKKAYQEFIDAVSNPIKIGRATFYEFQTAEALQLLKEECSWHLEFESSGKNGFVSSGDVKKSLRAASHQITKEVK
jgi:hypothetical protein